ncbi:hypothetical protein [Pseudomonas sp. FP198]|uniref:hypothetical protein n=1 Tax=Pseudomonas sp. FP198 TaxID=2954084 RepID=UPI0027352732|nr:hypothetical protein [Pseudomonas sp. FP198]WLG95249.1 hypothetical protein PSH78_23335 [Pseudomonas sp. FP198]
MNIERLPAGEGLLHSSSASRAAVVGSSIVSFERGLSPQDREDIYLSNLYAQLATRSAYRDGLVGNWFDYYKNKLRFLGWDTARPVRLMEAGQGLMADSVSRQLSLSLAGRFSQQASQALGALENSPDAIEIFEGASLRRDRGFFQVIPCVLKSPGKIEIALYHKQFSTRRTVSKFLFWPMEEVVATSLEQMALITFSTLHYGTFRKKVAAAVLDETARNIHALEF